MEVIGIAPVVAEVANANSALSMMALVNLVVLTGKPMLVNCWMNLCRMVPGRQPLERSGVKIWFCTTTKTLAAVHSETSPC